jgi:outer membrane protein
VGYQLGIRINSDVLDAERQLYSSRRDLAKARYDTLFLGLQLKAAVGGLSAGDIGVINTLLAGSKLTTAMPAKSEQGSAEYAQ